MFDTSGDINFTSSAAGVTLEDDRRKGRLFKITSGTNPYAAQEVVLSEVDGSYTDGAYTLSASTKGLWEINGTTTVAANTVVEGWPNPFGTGFYFDADPAGSAGSALDVRNTDGTAIDATTTSLRFDKATGLSTAGTAGTSTVSGIAASASQTGMVNQLPQILGQGTKGLKNGSLTIQGFATASGLEQASAARSAADISNSDNIAWLACLAQGDLPSIVRLKVISSAFNAGSHRGYSAVLAGTGERFGMIAVDPADASAHKGLPLPSSTASASDPASVLGTYEASTGGLPSYSFQIGAGTDAAGQPAQYSLMSSGSLYLGWRGTVEETHGVNALKKYYAGGIIYRVDKNGVQQALGTNVVV